MSAYSSIIDWAIKAVTSEVKKSALAKLKEDLGSVLTFVSEHAPDMKKECEATLHDAATKAVAGAVTRTED